MISGPGELYALLGSNGAGKTTTLRMVSGLLKPDSGSIGVFGVDVARDPVAAKRMTALLPDEPMIYDKPHRRLCGRGAGYFARDPRVRVVETVFTLAVDGAACQATPRQPLPQPAKGLMSVSPGMSNCLVTGGAGFIGCALSAQLAARCKRVVAVDKLLPQVHQKQERPAALNPNVEFILRDVTDRALWDDLLPEFSPDIIIHLAAETGTGQSLREASRHGRENVVGTTEMTDGLARHGIVPKQFILSSSRAVYGEGAWKAADGSIVYPGGRSAEQLARGEWDFSGLTYTSLMADITQPRPANVYAATKLAQEHLLEAWTQAFGSKLTILRLQNVFGPGQSLTNSYTGIVSLFARIAREGGSIPLYEDGEMLRDFVFIDDVASAFIAAIEASPAGVTRFDIGTGKAESIATIAKILAADYGAPAPHITGQYRLGDVRHARCDIAASLAHLPWSPRWPIDKGLRALCAWIDSQLS